ncbi:MAG: DNA polymerase III subunit delta' [Alphaproteobacteria bacterium]|nr:DNA polymerase III subunit delta' [Alphaproteobacteria bacterium]
MSTAPPDDPAAAVQAALSPPPGNEPVRERLVRLAQAERLHHCMLFEGPDGVGKLWTARWLAMLVNCDGPAEMFGPRTVPCGACWSCRQIARDQHPDVIRVQSDPDKASKAITVKQARELLSALSLHPFHARLRVVIIEPVDALTVEAANALLKTLEEPPAQTAFVLLTDRAAALLATVRSRSQRIRFGPVDVDRVADWLQAQGIEDGRRLAVLADGRPLRARELADGEREAGDDALHGVLDAIDGGVHGRQSWTEANAKGDRAAALAHADRVMDALERLARDALIVAAGADRPLYDEARRPLAAGWADRLGVRGVAGVEAVLARTRADLDANVNTRLALDAMLAGLAAELGPPR